MEIDDQAYYIMLDLPHLCQERPSGWHSCLLYGGYGSFYCTYLGCPGADMSDVYLVLFAYHSQTLLTVWQHRHTVTDVFLCCITSFFNQHYSVPPPWWWWDIGLCIILKVWIVWEEVSIRTKLLTFGSNISGGHSLATFIPLVHNLNKILRDSMVFLQLLFVVFKLSRFLSTHLS